MNFFDGILFIGFQKAKKTYIDEAVTKIENITINGIYYDSIYYYYLAYEIKKGVCLFLFNTQYDNPLERTH